MAVIAVNLAPRTFAEIMNLVSAGSYTGPEQFVEIAVFNQIALEKGASLTELMTVESSQKSAKDLITRKAPRASPGTKDLGSQVSLSTKGKEPIGRQSRSSTVWKEVELKQALARMSLSHATSVSLPIADDSPTAPGRERIWGQVNRLFPVKLACRWVAVAAAIRGQWPTLDAIAEPLASDAALLGSALEKADMSKSRKREDMLATGLPRRGNLQSRDRFLSQFVARITRAGRIYPGALFHYGFACFREEKLVLTKAGVDFSKLENPIMDEPFGSAGLALSNSERAFFLRQIAGYAETEWREFKAVLSAIRSGSSAPDSLLASVRNFLPSEWTEMAYRTHIYGILARVCDLGLVAKQWDGRRVKYNVTSSAGAVLAA